MNIKTKTITLLAVALALMFVLTPIPLVSLFLVPVLFIGLTQKWYLGAVSGLMFGLVSLMFAFVGPGAGTPVAMAFVAMPWIAIVPRIFVGIATSFSFLLFRKLIKPNGKVSRILPYNLAATAGTLTNTILVIGSFFLMEHVRPGFVGVLAGYNVTFNFNALFLINILPFAAIEIVVANIIAAPVSLGVAKAMRVGEFAAKPQTMHNAQRTTHNGCQDSTEISSQENNVHLNNTDAPN